MHKQTKQPELMEKDKEIICLNALERLLSAHVDDACYSLDGPKDSAVCLERTENGWEVYEQERNAKDNVGCFGNIVEACLEMITRLFKKTETGLYKDDFLNAVIGQN